MNRYVQVRILQVYGASPVLNTYSCTYRLNSLHFGVQAWDMHIQLGDVENQSESLVGFQNKKRAHVKRSVTELRLRDVSYGPLLAKGRKLLQ